MNIKEEEMKIIRYVSDSEIKDFIENSKDSKSYAIKRLIQKSLPEKGYYHTKQIIISIEGGE